MTRKVWLYIVTKHDKDRINKFLPIMQSVSLSSDTSASKSWSKIQESIYKNALEYFGKKKHTNKDWFNENINVLFPLIKVKRQAHVDYQYDASCTSLEWLRKARKTFRKTARKCAKEFWLKTSAGIRAAADRGDTKSVYDVIRKTVGPTIKLTSPLQSATGETLHSRNENWVDGSITFLFYIQNRTLLLMLHFSTLKVCQGWMIWITNQLLKKSVKLLMQ